MTGQVVATDGASILIGVLWQTAHPTRPVKNPTWLVIYLTTRQLSFYGSDSIAFQRYLLTSSCHFNQSIDELIHTIQKQEEEMLNTMKRLQQKSKLVEQLQQELHTSKQKIVEEKKKSADLNGIIQQRIQAKDDEI